MAPSVIDAPPSSVDRVRRFFEARDLVRRGICLLNAGQYDLAAGVFSSASRLNPESSEFRPYLARCHAANQDYAAAANEMSRLAEEDAEDITSRVRHALYLWKHGDCKAAIASLRECVRGAADCAELHFQLGTLLAADGEQEEAALRFTQTLAMDKRHTEAMVSLAMCHAADSEVRRATTLLSRAQSLRPHDARIGHLLSMSLKAMDGTAAVPHVSAVMPPDGEVERAEFIEELAKLIESDAEFIDAFISVPATDVDSTLGQLLAKVAKQALERSPDRVDLHYHYGRLQDRSGNVAGAMNTLERAVAIDPRHVPALILLGRLYRRQDRPTEAIDCLERALRTGVDYPDVHVTLGDLYRDSGRTADARNAYSRAVRINAGYELAQQSLEALSV